MNAPDEYRRRLEIHQSRAARARSWDLRLGAAKLVLVFVLLGLAWLAWISHVFSGLWLWLPLVALVGLFVAHGRVVGARAGADRTVGFYQHGLARLGLAELAAGERPGPSGERFRTPDHVYADDLDVFGPGSLFELLSRARTPMGEERLADWLTHPAAPVEIRRRQQSVEGWRDQLDLREEVGGLGDELKQRLQPARLAAWAKEPAPPAPLAGRISLAGLGVLAIAAGLYALGTGRLGPFFVVVLIEAMVVWGLRARVAAALGNIGANGEGLLLFAQVLQRVPAEAGPLRRLAHLADWIDASETTLGRILDFTVLYSAQLAYAADAWRRRYGAEVAGWLALVGEFEALLSLASHAFEHPEDPFAEIVEDAGPIFQGEGLGHPLLPATGLVRNSIALDGATRLLLVSGSNMSGKSTLLRTVGVNAVLAQMGAPVRARSLRLSPLALGTRLRTSDSLQQGRSGFYAEILRLRQVFDLTVPGPCGAGGLAVLFLFDELLEGTNSHDRVLGAAGLLRALLARPSLGLVTTHDLALAAMAAELGPTVKNVHFEDQIEGNDVNFDHRLREGVVTKSNALALMRIIGLEV